GEFGHERVVENATSRGKDYRPRALSVSVYTGQRRIDHVDPQDHSRAPAVRRVIDPAALEGRPVTVVAEFEPGSLLDRLAHRTLLAKPPECLREEGEDVEIQGCAPGTGSVEDVDQNATLLTDRGGLGHGTESV